VTGLGGLWRVSPHLENNPVERGEGTPPPQVACGVISIMPCTWFGIIGYVSIRMPGKCSGVSRQHVSRIFPGSDNCTFASSTRPRTHRRPAVQIVTKYSPDEGSCVCSGGSLFGFASRPARVPGRLGLCCQVHLRESATLEFSEVHAFGDVGLRHGSVTTKTRRH
jgi:hypothetical protein